MTGPVLPPWAMVPEPPRRPGGWRPGLFGFALLAGLAVGVVCYSLRAPAGRSIGLGVTVTLAGYLTMLLADRIAAARSTEQPAPLESLRPLVSRWEIPGFAELRGKPVVGLPEPARLRMRDAVTAELSGRGIPFDSQPARELLGHQVHQLLAEAPERRPAPAEITELLRSVADVLDPGTPSDQKGPMR